MKYEQFLPALVEKCPELTDALTRHRAYYDGQDLAHNFFTEVVVPMVMAAEESGEMPPAADTFLRRCFDFLDEVVTDEEDDLVSQAIVLSFLAGIGSPQSYPDVYWAIGPNLRRWWDINGGQG